LSRREWRGTPQQERRCGEVDDRRNGERPLDAPVSVALDGTATPGYGIDRMLEVRDCLGDAATRDRGWMSWMKQCGRRC
jgi:hypothetical protein